MVRDFFWDDEFRTKWDPMLTYVKILDECPHTGTMIVHWIKKVCKTWEILECNCCMVPLNASIVFPFCSSPFSAVIENMSWVEEYGRLQKLTIV